MKKEKYEEYNGIFGNAIDYAVYHLTMRDMVLGALVGGIAGGVVVMIYFNLIWLAVIAIPVCAIAGIIVNKSIQLDKRSRKLTLQFRDMLESISSSLGSGRNVKDAFTGAYNDTLSQYGEEAFIVEELEIILKGMASNINIEDLLQDFAKRSHNENIQNFADVFAVANRRGGNLRQIIFETKNVINEKIMVEQDIQTVISGKKNELNIMMVLPLIIVNQLKGIQGSGDDMMFTLLIKLVAFVMFIVAYIVGRKMMKIEV